MAVLEAAPARTATPEPGAAPSGLRPARLPSPLAGWLVTLGVGLVAFGLRAWHVARVPGKMFDEVYYAVDAHSLLRHGVELKADGAPSFVVHPPLGKWCIALGEAVFGDRELGWRAASVVAGTLTVLVVVRLARRMTGSTLLAGLAGLLMTVDGLALVQGRTSMLDVFLCLFLTAAFACLVLDRDDGRRRLAAALASGAATGRFGPALGLRPWRLATALLLGAALATKWSAVFYLAAFPLLGFAWDVGARRRAGIGRPLRAALRHDALPSALGYVLVPLAVYVASWTGWFATSGGWDRHWAETHPGGVLPGVIRSWLHYHHEMLAFHSGLSARHPYQSHPGSWLVLGRPVAYYYASLKPGELGCVAAGGCSREVLAIGNPVLWWSAVPVVALTAWSWVTRRDWRSGAVVVGYAVGVLPWVYYDLADRRTEFLFYALPALPFLVLGATLLVGRAVRRRPVLGSAFAGAWVLAVVVVFVMQRPILVGDVIPYHQWSQLMWFRSWI